MEEKGIKVKEIADGLSALNAMNVMVMSAKKAYELKDDPEVKEEMENMVLSLHLLALEDSGKKNIGEIVKIFTDIINTQEK